MLNKNELALVLKGKGNHSNDLKNGHVSAEDRWCICWCHNETFQEFSPGIKTEYNMEEKPNVSNVGYGSISDSNHDGNTVEQYLFDVELSATPELIVASNNYNNKRLFLIISWKCWNTR